MSLGGAISVVKGFTSKQTPPSDHLTKLSLRDQTAPVENDLQSKTQSNVMMTAPSKGVSYMSAGTNTAQSDEGSSSQSVTTAATAAESNHLDNILDPKVTSTSRWNIKLPQDEYVAVNNDGSIIYVSDWETNTITANIIFEYKSPDLSKVKAIYVDSNANILVNGAHTGKVM